MPASGSESLVARRAPVILAVGIVHCDLAHAYIGIDLFAAKRTFNFIGEIWFFLFHLKPLPAIGLITDY